MVTESAKIDAGAVGASSVGELGIAVLKTTAGILVGAGVGVAVVASGIIALAGFAFYHMCSRK